MGIIISREHPHYCHKCDASVSVFLFQALGFQKTEAVTASFKEGQILLDQT